MDNTSARWIGKVTDSSITLCLAIGCGLMLSAALSIIGCRDVTDFPATGEFMERETVTPVEENKSSVELPEMRNLILTQIDADQSFTVKQGDIIEIELEENLSTGYQWEIDEVDYELVVLKSSDPLPIQELAPGVGGMRRFRFRADAAGTTNIKLKYWQSWEGDKSIVARFNIIIVIAD